MRILLAGKELSSSKSFPSKIAGVKGQPQFLFKGGPELKGAKGMSTASTFKPGKAGFEAAG